MLMKRGNRLFVSIRFLLGIVALLAGAGGFTAEDGSIRGLVKPQKQALISSEIAARVTAVPFSSGEAFAKDDVLIDLDCAVYRAQLDAATADRDARTSQYENARELLTYRATSPLEVALRKSEMQQARARYEMESQRVRGCQIIAPYAGRIINVEVNEHESVNPGSGLLSILSNENLEIELIVPSSWLSWLEVGQTFDFRIDETGTTHAATIRRIGAMVDPVSQTIQIVGVFEDVDDSVLSGMSGSAVFDKSR